MRPRGNRSFLMNAYIFSIIMTMESISNKDDLHQHLHNTGNSPS